MKEGEYLRMVKYILKRIGLMIPVILGVLLIVFIANRMSGDPAASILGPNASEEAYEQVREELGLNKPMVVQFISYVQGIVTRGDFGKSYSSGKPVFDEIMSRLPTTLTLALFSLIIATVVGVMFGVFCAVNQNKIGDYVITLLALIAASLPNFWFALMLILFFAVRLRLVPASGLDTWSAWILPSVVMGLSPLANICRTTRSSMLEVIRQDYIRTAKSKGISQRDVIFKHALQNAMFPIITVFGLMASLSIGGQMVVENVFTIPGVGSYMMQAIGHKDYPVIQGTVVVLSLIVCIINLFVDIAYGFADPRIRAGYSSKKKKKVVSKIAEEGSV